MTTNMNTSSWQQYKAVLIIILGSLGWLTCAQPMAGSKANATELVTRVIREYALTSANDFPQRDPLDWRLLASNDHGQSWATLDVRRNELFPNRQQQRIFKIANPSANNIYRLQIDRVRDISVADAVQIAEIELMGEGTNDLSPTPLFMDLITAQGAYPPEESVLRLFDGRVETKWLEMANPTNITRASWIQWQYCDRHNFVITNCDELRLLRAQAGDGFKVRVKGTVVGSASTTDGLCLLDNTGYINVVGVGRSASFAPGAHLLIEGRSQWVDGRAEVGNPIVTVLEPQESSEPKAIEIGRHMEPAIDFQWVETEGEVQFLTHLEDRVIFDLSDGQHSLSVCLLQAVQGQYLPSVGTRVKVRGICTGAFDDHGNHVPRTLWISQAEAVTPLRSSLTITLPEEINSPPVQPPTNSLYLTNLAQVSGLPAADLGLRLRIKAQGVVTEYLGDYLQQGSAGIELIRKNMAIPAPCFGNFVETEGNLEWSPGTGWLVVVDKIQILGNGKLPEPARPSWQQLAGGEMDSRWVEVQAVVRATDGSHLLLDFCGHQMMATIRLAQVGAVNQLVDATVVLRGVCVNATDSHGNIQGVQVVVLSLEQVEVKESAPDPMTMPVRPAASVFQLGSQINFSHRIKVRGVLTGNEGRKHFLKDGAASLTIIAQANVSLTEMPIGTRWVFWQTPADDADSAWPTDLTAGDEIEVIGFPETQGFRPLISDALVRKVKRSSPLPPVKTTAGELSLGGLDSTLVSLEGEMLGSEMLGSRYVMQIQSDLNVFQATLQIKAAHAPEVALGSRVRVTGVCQMEDPAYMELGKRASVFSLLLRAPADIAILQPPPWWTRQRALTVAGVLLLVLMAAILWIHTLQIKVEERTKLLKLEIAEHEKTENRLEEKTKLLQKEIEEHRQAEASLAEKTVLLEREIKNREQIQSEVEKVHRQLILASRWAGMADVATSVLHNVGNVLNSVNVLASLIVDSLKRSKVPYVAKLATLINEHRLDLARFLINDENGKYVPAHLERLGILLKEEQTRLVEKARALTEGIQHVKGIVAMQQNFARAAGVLESARISEVVDDALKLCVTALERHGIHLEKDYQDLPPVTLDRHKVLQIMFNLLDNAKHACEAGPNTAQKKIIVRIRSGGPGRIRIQVADNGIGISSSNLEKIFTQGFSTQKDGHGFGLHGSILTAQEMGATLTVRSDGPDAGATFTLEIPNAANDQSSPLKLTAKS